MYLVSQFPSLTEHESMALSNWFRVICCVVLFPMPLAAQDQLAAAPSAEQLRAGLSQALAFHAGFDESLNADFARGDSQAYYGSEPATVNDDVAIVDNAGRFGKALQFKRKSRFWPAYGDGGSVGYNADDWNATVSLWLKLDPDKQLEPGYCDPVQVIGNDYNQGFIFLEWSKDHSPRHFRYAIRPLVSIWNPQNVGWEDIPDDKRPMVVIQDPIFSADRWTHLVFTLEHINVAGQASGTLYVDGKPRGTIENWDLKFGWDPQSVKLVLGAAYVGLIDDVAVFDRVLTAAEIELLHGLENGVAELR